MKRRGFLMAAVGVLCAPLSTCSRKSATGPVGTIRPRLTASQRQAILDHYRENYGLPRQRPFAIPALLTRTRT